LSDEKRAIGVMQVLCDTCGYMMTPCFNAGQKMQCRAWWCQKCDRITPAIGRERLITLEDYEQARATDEANTNKTVL